MPLTLLPVSPVGYFRSDCFVERSNGGSGMESAVFPDYPNSPCGRALRERRIDLNITLRAGAKMLGISAMELSGLELGSITLVAEDWDKAMQMLKLR